MKKRTERNQGLYQTVNQQISDVQKRVDNTEFEEKTTVYSKIDPNYFEGKEKKEKNNKAKISKKTIITIAFLALILVALIIIGVVIYHGTK